MVKLPDSGVEWRFAAVRRLLARLDGHVGPLIMALVQLVVLHALAFTAPRWAPRARVGEVAVRMAAGADDAELREILGGTHKAPSGKLRKNLAKGKKGLLTIIGGYNKRWPAIDFAKGEYNARELDEIEYVTSQFRLGGAVAVNIEVGDEACDLDDLRAAVAEQAAAKGEFPGPCPVMMSGEVSDELHLAEAKRIGCDAVAIDMGALGEAKVCAVHRYARAARRHARAAPRSAWRRCALTPRAPSPLPTRARACTRQAAELVQTAGSLGLEALVIAPATADGIGAAAMLGSDLLCARGATLDECAAAAAAFPEGCVRVAMAPVADVREAWSMRDAGFNAVALGNEMLQQSTIERVEIQSILKAMRAKVGAALRSAALRARGPRAGA